MNRLYLSQPFVACYDNNLDAFIPELWAQEGLAILEENMVMANLVHRDFENEIAKFGDVVNTRRPGEFKIRRKTDGTVLAQPGRHRHQRAGAAWTSGSTSPSSSGTAKAASPSRS